MWHSMRSTWLILLMLGCASAPTPAPEPATAEPPEPEAAAAAAPILRPTLDVLQQPRELTFADDATLRLPAGWSTATTEDGSIVFAAVPEGDLQIVILSRELPPERGPGITERLVTEAWRTVDPSFDRAVLQVSRGQALAGWDLLTQVSFETAPSEARGIVTVLQAKGERAVLALIDGSVDAFGRRGAQLNEVIGSIRIPGVEEQDWMALERREIDEAAIARLVERIEAERVRAEVPGAAVVLVTSDEVLLARGFGTRALGSDEAVTPATRFMIGSITKAFTTLLAAKLVDEGAAQWDQPLSELLPEFRLADPEASAAITLARAFCSCTGLPRRDLEFIFEFAEASPSTTLTHLANVAPTTAMGETFQYSNLLVAAGGFALGRAQDPRRSLDAAYGRLLERAIFRPLGMRSTTLDPRRALRAEHARPSARGLDGEVRAIDPAIEEFVNGVEPAGAVWSTAEDMGRYLQMELRNGALPRGRLLGEEALLRRRQPSVAMGPNTHYGLGLVVGRRSNVAFAGHGGNTIGFTSNMIFFPELDLGLVVLTNLGGANQLTDAVDRMVMEMVLPIEERAEAAGAERRQARSAALSRLAGQLTTPTEDERDAVLGRYESNELGPVEVRMDGERVVLDAGEWSSTLGVIEASGERHWILTDPPLASLAVRQDGDRLVVPTPQHDYVFTRAAASE